jgi:hypothetical protein
MKPQRFDDSHHSLCHGNIVAVCVFWLCVPPRTCGYEKRLVFIPRDEFNPESWPMDGNGKRAELIGILPNLDPYVGKEVRIAKFDNQEGCGAVAVLEFNEKKHWYECNGLCFSYNDIDSVHAFEDTIRIQLRKLVE